MSELTQCNYCSLRNYRSKAKKSDMVVSLRPGWNGGVDILVHPKTIKIPKGELCDGNPLRKRYWRSWCMEIGDSCCC